MSTFDLKIWNMDSEMFSGRVQSLRSRAIDGDLEILPGHIPYINYLIKGKVSYTTENGSPQAIDISGGVLKVLNGKVDLLVRD